MSGLDLTTSEEASAGSLTGTEIVRISRTTDGGTTWSNFQTTLDNVAGLAPAPPPASADAGSLASGIAAAAKTLRRSINAYRPEPSDLNRSTAYNVFNSAKATNTDGAISVWEPDGVNFYGAAWTRDQAMSMEGYLDYFDPAEISAIATYWLSKCNLSTGEVPDHIGNDGTVFFAPAPTGRGSRAPVDGNSYIMQFFWLHYVSTGSATLYNAHKVALKGLLEAPGVLYNGTTNCVNISDSSPYVGFGFFDMAEITGDVLFPTILMVRAQQMAAEMEFSLGNYTEAARLLGRANTIKGGINANMIFRGAGSGAELADPYNGREIAYGLLGTIKGLNQIDLWSSAYAVWCDIVTPDDARRIANYLHYTTGSTLGNYYRGCLRNVDQVTDFSPGSQVYQGIFSSRPYGTYQNGGFWPTPASWLQYTISLVNPALARKMYLDLYSFALEQGAVQLNEWVGTTPTVFGAQKYLTSVVTLLVVGEVDGPVLQDCEWTGLIRSVNNETLTLVMNVPFQGTIISTSTKSASGTATATFQIGATALGGAANAVSSTEQTVAQSTVNTFVSGNDIKLTVSGNASCVDLYFTITFKRAA